MHFKYFKLNSRNKITVTNQTSSGGEHVPSDTFDSKADITVEDLIKRIEMEEVGDSDKKRSVEVGGGSRVKLTGRDGIV